jgi:hypothetical protein
MHDPRLLRMQLRGESLQTLPVHASTARLAFTISQAISRFFR